MTCPKLDDFQTFQEGVSPEGKLLALEIESMSGQRCKFVSFCNGDFGRSDYLQFFVMAPAILDLQFPEHDVSFAEWLILRA